jgi:MYXO-CTERM domain-containing protein
MSARSAEQEDRSMISIPRWLLVSSVAPLALFASGAADANQSSSADEAADRAALSSIVPLPSQDLCPGPAPAGEMRCLSKLISPSGIVPYPQGGGSSGGFAPADLLSAYAIPASSASGGKIVALVDATDSSGAFTDLTTYRAKYGLPTLPQCTSAPTSGGPACFYKVNQSGQASNYPAADPRNGWQGEIALDIEMVSAVCPDCTILLVEATSATDANLGAAVNTAARLGASVISNSYGGAEDNSASSSSTQYYTHAGILITAAAGDDAYSAGASFPASAPNVLGVGGTSLARSSSSRGWAETAWSSGGSGCSETFAAPSFQASLGLSDCSKRAVADVSAVGDPNTGLATYCADEGGWIVVGGTSAASPIVAGIFARLGLSNETNAFPYSHTSAFYDVTSGSNGSCGGTEICTARAGYDGPTGIGTPNGAVLASSGTTTPPPPAPDAGAPSGGMDSGTTPPPAVDAGAAPDASTGSADSGSGGGGSGNDSGLTLGSDSGSSYGGGNGGGDTPDSGSTANGGNGGTDDPGGWSDTSGSGSSGGCSMGSGAPATGSFAVFAAVIALGARRRRRSKR